MVKTGNSEEDGFLSHEGHEANGRKESDFEPQRHRDTEINRFELMPWTSVPLCLCGEYLFFKNEGKRSFDHESAAAGSLAGAG
jgi:hypothetical protein